MRGLAAELVAAVPEVCTVVNTHAGERSPQSEPDGEVTESVKALAVTFQVRWYREVALNVLAVQIWLFTFPPPLYCVKTYIVHVYDVKKCLTHLT